MLIDIFFFLMSAAVSRIIAASPSF